MGVFVFGFTPKLEEMIKILTSFFQFAIYVTAASQSNDVRDFFVAEGERL